MYIGLFLVKPIMKKGHYPIIDEKNIKKYWIKDLKTALDLGRFFLDNINEECETILGPYEYDYLTPQQCELLICWINNNKELINASNLSTLFDVIKEYCDEAIKLDTGIEIEV